VQTVAQEILEMDPIGERTACVLRNTFDQLYHGRHTGRYRWDQLYKTEKTHCGTLVEINLQREFKFGDGTDLDYRIAGVEVDCKYSQTPGGWMIPPETLDHLCLVISASDVESKWSMGLVRITSARLRPGVNRDAKSSLNEEGRKAIHWLFQDAPLPPNILLQLPEEVVNGIMRLSSGQKRVNELFRRTLGMRVGRGVVETVAQQDDSMKRVRTNGGARTLLRPEGIVILGQYHSHTAIARALEVPVPGPGESVAVRLSPASQDDPCVVRIEGRWWRVADANDPVVPAPLLPSTAP
jgi:hypothetical protein